MTVRARIILLSAFAAAVSLALGGALIYRSYEEVRSLNNFRKVSDFLVEMINVGDAWTQESGGVWNYYEEYAPPGTVEEGRKEYRNRIAKADAHMEALGLIIADMDMDGYSPRFQEMLRTQFDLKTRLKPVRDRTLVHKESAWLTTLVYNDEIKRLVALIPQLGTETDDPELVRKIMVADLILQAQLMLNRHEGMLNYALSSGQITEMVTTRFEGFQDDSAPMLDRIRMILTPDGLDEFNEYLDSAELALINEATQQVLDSGIMEGGVAKTYDPDYTAKVKKATEVMDQKVAIFRQFILDDIGNYTQQRIRDANQAMYTVTGVVAAALLAFTLACAYILKRITRTMRTVSGELETGAEGGERLAGFIASASQDLASGCSEQAASIEEIHATMEGITATAQESVESVGRVLELAGRSDTSAHGSYDSMKQMRAAMKRIQESSDQIAKIVGTIEEIAFQTNILALNAAVEAARAGEAGAGFAVVAEEVRALAQKSAQSANSTREMIENATRSVQEGTALSERVEKQLAEIFDQISGFKTAMREIEEMSGSQRAAIDQVSTAIGEIESVTQRNASAAEESASASQEMDAHARNIQRQIRELEVMLMGSALSNGHRKGTTQPVAKATSHPQHPAHHPVGRALANGRQPNGQPRQLLHK